MESEVQGAADGMEAATGKAAGGAQRDAGRMGAAFAGAASEMEAEVDDATSGMGTSLGGVGDAAKRAGAVIGGALAVSAVADTFDDSAVAAGRLQARLGLTSDEAEEFDTVAKRVYRNNFGESMVQAADTVGLVHQALGLQGRRLQETTEDVMALSDAFEDQGADSQIVVEAVRAMKQAYPGMSEKRILDLITHSFQEGAGTAGDFQDTLQEYPQHFKAIGLSSKDMTNFLTIGMQNGARNTDFLADAVKEFGIRVKTAGDTGQKALHRMFPPDQAKRLIDDFARGGEAGRNAFFTVMRQLSRTDDRQRRYNLAVELFGTKAEDMVGVLDKMTPAFLRSKNAQDRSAGATDHLDSQYTGIQNTIESFKRAIETSFVGALGEGAGAAVEFGGQAGVAIMGLSAVSGTAAGAMIKSWGASAAAAGRATIAHVAAVGRQIAMWTVLGAQAMIRGAMIAAAWLLAMGPIGLIILAVIGLAALIVSQWDHIKDFLSKAWNWIKDTAENVWGKLKDYFARYWPIILGLFTGPLGLIVGLVIKHWDEIKEKVTGVGETIKTAVSGAWEWIRAKVAEKVEAVRAAVAGKIDAVRDKMAAVWGTIKTAVSTAWEAVRSFVATKIEAVRMAVAEKVDAVRDKMALAWETIKTAAGNAWELIRDKIVNPIGNAIERVKEIIGNVVTWLGEKWSAITERVGTFGENVKEKAVNAFKGAANAVIGFVNAIINAVNKIPGVNIGTIDKLAEGGVTGGGRKGAKAQALATGGRVTRPMAIVGEEAPRHPEYVIPTNPAYRGRAIALTSSLMRELGMGGIPGFSVGGVIDKAAGAVGAGVDLVTGGPGAILKLLPNPAESLPTWLRGMGGWAIDKATAWIKDKVKEVLAALNPLGGGSGGTTGTWKLANKLASLFGLSITSDYRDPAHNAAVGGAPNSSHMRGSPANPGAHDFMPASVAALRYAMNQLGAMWADNHAPGPHLHVSWFKEGGVFGGLPYLGTYHDGGFAPAEGLAHVAAGEPIGARIPEVNIRFANGMEWLRDFVKVEIGEKDRADRGTHLAGVTP